MTLTEVPNNFSNSKNHHYFLNAIWCRNSSIFHGLALEILAETLAKNIKLISLKKDEKSAENHIIICGFGRNKKLPEN